MRDNRKPLADDAWITIFCKIGRVPFLHHKRHQHMNLRKHLLPHWASKRKSGPIEKGGKTYKNKHNIIMTSFETIHFTRKNFKWIFKKHTCSISFKLESQVKKDNWIFFISNKRIYRKEINWIKFYRK